MTRQANQRLVRAFAIGFAAVPVGFGALRALTTGTDFRYLVTALAALAVAGMTFRAGSRRVKSPWLLTFLAFALSTLAGAIAAFGQGATSAAAVGTVAMAFALCVTASGMLGLFSRKAK